jgi:hypothetical protein
MSREHELPDGVRAARDASIERDPVAAEVRGRQTLDATGAAIVAGVERTIPAWVAAQVSRIADAWGQLDPQDRRALDDAVPAAGRAAAQRVVGRLEPLLRTDPESQASTPLEIVRTVYREPTALLDGAGIPPVVRDEFEERAWPDDVYGLVPRTLGDLGDDELTPLQLAWGVAKVTVLRARRAQPM